MWGVSQVCLLRCEGRRSEEGKPVVHCEHGGDKGLRVLRRLRNGDLHTMRVSLVTSKSEQKGWISPCTLEVATVWLARMQGCVGK